VHYLLCDSVRGIRGANSLQSGPLCRTLEIRQSIERSLVQIQGQLGDTYALASLRAVGLNLSTSG